MLKILRALLAIGILGLLPHAASAEDQACACNCDASPAGDCEQCCGLPDCCGAAGCCDQPLWSIMAGADFLSRSRPDAQQIIHPVGSNTTVSDGTDFDFAYSTGADITIDRSLGNGNSLELRYLGAFDWRSDAVDYGAVGNVQIGSFSNFGAIGLLARDDTQLNSAEINWLHPVTDRITFLAGARYLDLHDALQYQISFPAFSANYNWTEANRLYGGQIGGKFALWNLDGPFSVNAILKAGVFANSADNQFDLLPSTGGSFPGGATANATSFVGEIDVMASYAFTPHVALQGGYELLWIDRLALATDQAAAATANDTQNGISTIADLFTYGATAAVVVTW